MDQCGWMWHLDNIQTLCPSCDKEKMKEDNKFVCKNTLSKKELVERKKHSERCRVALKLLHKTNRSW